MILNAIAPVHENVQRVARAEQVVSGGGGGARRRGWRGRLRRARGQGQHAKDAGRYFNETTGHLAGSCCASGRRDGVHRLAGEPASATGPETTRRRRGCNEKFTHLGAEEL